MPRNSNFYEDVASEAAKDLKAMLPDVAKEVMGGQRPPWTVELKGQQLADYWMALPIQQKMERWGQMTPAEQLEVKKVTGQGY